LTGSVASAYSQFGFSVAVEGNTAVVGAYFDDVGVTPYPGSAYVFTRSGATWTQQDRLTASDGASSDNFGYSVALDSGTALIGAPLHDVSDGTTVAQDAGQAYIFVLVSDTDNDGVIDANDACPAQAGPANNNGCPLPPPDTDNDGVIDANDACPAQAGPANNNGCPLPPPDGDGDGVIDADDSCPTVGGPANNSGCPVPNFPAPSSSPSATATPTASPSPTPTDEPLPDLPQCETDPTAVCGTDGDDNIVIDASSDPDGDGVVEVYLGAGDDTVCVQIGTGLSVIIHGQDGDDTVVVGDCGSRATRQPSGSVSGAAAPGSLDFSGGRGNDTFHGGADGETFRGGLGDDKATGSGGNDILRGGPNNDSIHGAAGADLVAGGLNDDELRGGAGHDTIKGGPGSDTLSGGPGTDTLDGGAHQDTCLGAGDKLLRCE
jgi:Ca2+-binding RTX toxin-like protein